MTKKTIKNDIKEESTESVAEFVSRAQMSCANGELEIEATQNIFDHFHNIVGDADFFTAYGVTVFKAGHKDKLKAEMNDDLASKIHPELVPGAPKPAAYAEDSKYIDGIETA